MERFQFCFLCTVLIATPLHLFMHSFFSPIFGRLALAHFPLFFGMGKWGQGVRLINGPEHQVSPLWSTKYSVVILSQARLGILHGCVKHYIITLKHSQPLKHMFLRGGVIVTKRHALGRKHLGFAPLAPFLSFYYSLGIVKSPSFAATSYYLR